MSVNAMTSPLPVIATPLPPGTGGSRPAWRNRACVPNLPAGVAAPAAPRGLRAITAASTRIPAADLTGEEDPVAGQQAGRVRAGRGQGDELTHDGGSYCCATGRGRKRSWLV